MFDDGVRQDEVEGSFSERQRHAVGHREVHVGQAAVAGKADPGVAEPVDRVDRDDRAGFLGKRERHASAAAAGVQDPSANRDAGAIEKRNHFGAAVVLE